jgi:hypothetical protein
MAGSLVVSHCVAVVSAASDREATVAAFAHLSAFRGEVASPSFDALSPSELLGLLDVLETDRRVQ